MQEAHIAIARACIEGAEQGTMTFPDILARLAEAGFEGYLIDYRQAVATYYQTDGQSVALPTHKTETPVARAFNAPALQDAIRQAQLNAPGYTYRGFCEQAAAAGCAGYLVSLPGRRVLYFARTGETHVELMP